MAVYLGSQLKSLKGGMQSLGEELSPKLHVTIIPNGSGVFALDNSVSCDWLVIKDGRIYVADDYMFEEEGFIKTINSGQSDVITIYATYYDGTVGVGNLSNILIRAEEFWYIDTVSMSNEINCTYDDDSGRIIFINPIQDASITATVTFTYSPII